MSAIPYDTPEGDLQHDQGDASLPPGRPRRRFLDRKSAALAALVTAAAGFFGGVEIEKSQLSTAATAAISPTAATGTATGARAGGGAGARGGFPFAGRGGAGGAGSASFGTVSSVNGNTIYLTEPTGNTVKVTLSSATKITKSQTTSKSSVRPGDSVVVQGVSSNGQTAATSINDSGTSAAGPGAGGARTGATGTGAASPATTG
jgi:Domain of unknown function (DUF5666)